MRPFALALFCVSACTGGGSPKGDDTGTPTPIDGDTDTDTDTDSDTDTDTDTDTDADTDTDTDTDTDADTDADTDTDADSDTDTDTDTGPGDTGISVDTGPGDTGISVDTGPGDTGTSVDTGTETGISVDTGTVDTGISVDTGSVDTGTVDTGTDTSISVDTGTDTSTVDTGTDTGISVDTGDPDTGTPSDTGETNGGDTSIGDTSVGDTSVGDTGPGDTDTGPEEADVDGDGWRPSEGDCDDADPALNPGAAEVCDSAGVDEDCDGLVDDADPDVTGTSTWFVDSDGDGYGDAGSAVHSCLSGGNLAFAGDCDDTDAAVSPDATEVCDPADADEDCDGRADDADPDATGATTWYADADGDGYGDAGTPSTACDADGTVADATDCEDADAAIHPGAAETCDPGDEDCDGLEGDADPDVTGTSAWYVDADGDGYGAGTAQAACAGDTLVDGDCDDGDAALNPGALEICDTAGTDEDCDGLVDDADPDVTGTSTWYADADADGFGDPAGAFSACEAGDGVSDSTDCDDADATINPDAAEVCDAADTDEDCDGLVDGDDPDVTGTMTVYADTDGDGYGDPDASSTGCDAGGTVADSSDCDDTDATINPGAVEVCDTAGTDEDCNGYADDDDADVTGTSTWYPDLDSDGYGNPGMSRVACGVSNAVTNGEDCDDTDATVNPSALSICGDGIDQDCDNDPSDCGFNAAMPSSSIDWTLGGDNTYDAMGASMDIGDVDGDGQLDVVGGMNGYDTPGSAAGEVVVWLGPITASGRASATGDAFRTGTAANDMLGTDLAVGDIDGDGIDDIVASALAYRSYRGGIFVNYGPISGTSTVTAATDAWYYEGAASESAGLRITSGGDLDGDGADDLAFSSTTASSSSLTRCGAVTVLYGSTTRRTGSTSTGDAVFYGTSASEIWRGAPTILRDIDGDGLDELMMSTADGTYGTAWVFLGDTSPLSGTVSRTTADITYTGADPGGQFGAASGNLGDNNGDGYGDFGVYQYSYRRLGLLYYGFQAFQGGVSPSTTAVASYGGAHTEEFGGVLSSPGDLDEDGSDEVLVGGGYEGYLYYGPLTGTGTNRDADVIFTMSDPTSLPNAGGFDVTGDGIEDVVLGASAGSTYGTSVGYLVIWEGGRE